MSLVLFDSHKKYYVIQDQVPMRRNGTPGSEEDMEAFYDRWLPVVAKEFYRLNGVKKSEQVNSSNYHLKLDCNSLNHSFLLGKATFSTGIFTASCKKLELCGNHEGLQTPQTQQGREDGHCQNHLQTS